MKALLNSQLSRQGVLRLALLSILPAALLLLGVADAQARGGRCYGVSYSNDRGGRAYVGPNGVAVQGENGRTAVATRDGAAYVGPNGAAVVHGDRDAGVISGPYIRAIPANAALCYYGGYNCYYVNGAYYRPTFYEGDTVYVVVTLN